MNTENNGHLGQRRPCERNKANTKLNNNMNTTTIKLTRKTMTTKAKEGHVNVTQHRDSHSYNITVYSHEV